MSEKTGERGKAVTTDSSTRDKIIDAGIKLFAEKGIDGTSVREIAELAGVNPSLISYHFGGKTALYIGILEGFGQTELEAVQRMLGKPQNQEEFKLRFRLFVEDLVEMHEARPELFLLIGRVLERADPQAEKMFEDVFLKIFKRLVAFLTEAQEMGFANPKVKALHLASFLTGGVADIFRMRWCQERFLGTNLQKPAERVALIDSIVELTFEGFLVAR